MMNLIEKFGEQREAFETAYEHGGWNRLGPFFTKDVTYEVMNMPFHCEINGITAFVAGLERATDRFDKLCVREIDVGGHMIAQEGNNVIVHSVLRFTRNGSPPIETGLWELATYKDGLIDRLIDVYDPGASERFSEWMTAWGEDLDPRYEGS